MGVEFEGDIDFGTASQFSLEQLTAHVPAYSEMSRTFQTSIQRVVSLGWLPVEMALWSQLIATAAAEAKRRCGKDILEDEQSPPDDVLAEFRKVFAEITPLDGKRPIKLAAEIIFEGGCKRIKTILRQEALISSALHRVNGLEAVMSAMITGAYAAFETLACDLWIAAINRHPSIARQMLEKSNIQLSAATMAGLNFNATNQMGTVLFNTKKYGFQAFNDIKESYKAAFGLEVDNIFSDTTAIYRIEKVRHLIAHRGGIVDAKFKAEMSGTDLGLLNVGSMIPLDGDRVKTLIQGCVDKAISLFNTIDAWSLSADTV